MAQIQLKRIYDQIEKTDGLRILVDRLWPRGISKADAKLDYWLKSLSPSADLRKSFHHGDDSFDEFKKKYKQELSSGEQKEALQQLKIILHRAEKVTILYAAKDEKKIMPLF